MSFDYRKFLDKVGENQSSFARYVGINSRTSRKYKAGDLEIPLAIKRVLTLRLRLQKARSEIVKLRESKMRSAKKASKQPKPDKITFKIKDKEIKRKERPF